MLQRYQIVKVGRAGKIRKRDAPDQRNSNPWISNGVGQKHVFGVNECQRNERGDKYQIKRKRRRQTIVPGGCDEQQRGKRFDRRISR